MSAADRNIPASWLSISALMFAVGVLFYSIYVSWCVVPYYKDSRQYTHSTFEYCWEKVGTDLHGGENE